MSKVPSLGYEEVIRALRRDGWVVVRQRGSHIRLHKHIGEETLKLVVPAHRPIKRSTLSHILKQARLTVEQFRDLLREPALRFRGQRPLIGWEARRAPVAVPRAGDRDPSPHGSVRSWESQVTRLAIKGDPFRLTGR